MIFSAQHCWIIILTICYFNNIASLPQQQLHHGPILPGLPLNTAPVLPAIGTNKIAGPKLSESYLPAVMQAIAYYVELIQYEPLYTTTIEPPYTLPATHSTGSTYNKSTVYFDSTPTSTSTARPISYIPITTTTMTRIPITTTKRPTTTTTRAAPTTSSWWSTQQTTPIHRPGYYAPEKPQSTLSADGINSKPVNNLLPTTTRTPIKPALTGDLPVLSISNSPYFSWYLEHRGKLLTKNPEYEFLHQLPADLLQDIENESYEQPSKVDLDNVNEFLRIYDDFFERIRFNPPSGPQTGKKRVPPTKPYVQFLMLYDLLKREAKRLMLHDFEGYSKKMLAQLNETTNGSAERQLYVILYYFIHQNEAIGRDIKTRCESIMEDLVNPYSVTAKALRYLKPLTFEL